jgi:hypothetical protein
MKQKLYLLSAAFLLFSLLSMSQSSLQKEVKPYFGQTGIKKKISELQSVKTIAPKPLDTNSIRQLKFRMKGFQNFIKPDKEGQIINGAEPEREGDAEERKALRSISTAVSSGSTQRIHSNFLSTDFYENSIGWPPDPSGDVGPAQVIVSTNSGIKVFDKPGVTDAPLVTPEGYSRTMAPSPLFITLDKFFSPVLPKESFTSDPHIRYDRLSKKWFVVAIEVGFEENGDLAGNNKILLAVSDGDKVTDSSSFTYYSFNSSLFPYNHKAPYTPFLDYPTLGIDKNSVVIGGNQFGYDSLTNVGYVIDKKKLIHGNLAVYPFKLGVLDFNKGTASGMVTPQGVHNDDPDTKKSFFAGTSYYNDALIIANIEYDKKNKPHLAKENMIRVEPYNYPRDISSPGGLQPIDPLDTRLLAATIYKNKLTGTSSLWTAHGIGVNKSGNFINGSDSDLVREIRNGARWYKIGNVYSTPRIFQSGTIYDSNQTSGRRAVQYFNPSVAASGQGHSIVSGTSGAYNEYLNVFAAGRYFGDELGASKAAVKATSTTAMYAPYVVSRGTHYYVGRWGDFSQSVVDPLDDQTIWTFQEYADVDDSYGIRAVQFKAPPPATPAAVGTLSNKTDTTITLEGSSVDHSGFFDPGTDAGGPGYNRLSVKSTGNIIVSNIKFISPTKISFRLNTKNKSAGQYILIITNPDGQLTVTDYTIAANTTALIAGNSSAQRAIRDKIAQAYITGSEVFPNPAIDKVTLQINAAKEHLARIVLLDINGKQLFEKKYTFYNGSNQALLPIEKFSKGTYIAAVYNADNVLIATQKIVKE